MPPYGGLCCGSCSSPEMNDIHWDWKRRSALALTGCQIKNFSYPCNRNSGCGFPWHHHRAWYCKKNPPPPKHNPLRSMRSISLIWRSAKVPTILHGASTIPFLQHRKQESRKIGIGQQLLNFGGEDGRNSFLIAALLFSLSLIPVSATRSVHPELPQPTRYNFKALFQKVPIGMLGCFSAGLANSAFFSMAPVFRTKICKSSIFYK